MAAFQRALTKMIYLLNSSENKPDASTPKL